MSTRIPPDQIQREFAETATTLPIAPTLMKELFDDPKMFRSFESFEGAGFSLADHSPTKLLVGRHKSAKGHLFKKYNDDRSDADQIKNYMRRIEGARLLRTFIAERGFRHVTAPRKWLYDLNSLSDRFPRRYLLIVEKVDLLESGDTKDAYDDIGKEQLIELATVLYFFRGLNSTTSNLPFTENGKIAFIDTERWHHDKDYLHKVEDRLSGKRYKQAMAVFKDLRRRGARALQSQFE